MKIIFSLLFFVFLFASPTFACSPNFEAHSFSQVNACTSNLKCFRECKQELIRRIEEADVYGGTVDHLMICGQKACGADLDCKKKFKPLNECDF